MMTESSPVPPPLPPDDQAAINALVESGFDKTVASESRPDMADRIAKAHELLSVLELPPNTDDASTLVNLTYLRVLRDRDERSANAPRDGGRTPVLSDDDIIAIDDLVGGSWSSRSGARGARAAELLSLLDFDVATPDVRSALVDRTYAAVLADAESRRSRLRLRPVEESSLPGRRTIGWRDFAAMAAMLLIGFGVVLSLVDGARFESRQMAAAAGLSRAGLGFGLFANDNDGHLPKAHDRGLDGRWWQVGNPDESHSAHLYLLVDRGYTSIQDLASPGNPFAQVTTEPGAQDWRSPSELSYSYQLYSQNPPRLAISAIPPTVLLADRSPVIERARRGQVFDPQAGSPNYRGVGQNLLFADGSVRFLHSPLLGSGDNIWLPKKVEDGIRPLTGREAPDAGDVYLGP